MALKIIRNDNPFRLEGQGTSLDWLPSTPANRKSVVVFLRLLHDDAGQLHFTLQRLAKILDSKNLP